MIYKKFFRILIGLKTKNHHFFSDGFGIEPAEGLPDKNRDKLLVHS